MARSIVEKISGAIIPFVYDFTPQMPDGGVVVVSSEAAAATTSAGATATSTVVLSTSRSGNVVTVILQAGTDYEDYKINISITLTSGVKLNYQIELRVRP